MTYDETIDGIAREFHKTYETLAPHLHYETRKASAVPWEEVPEKNKRLMRAVVFELLRRDVITTRKRIVNEIAGNAERQARHFNDHQEAARLEYVAELIKTRWENYGD